MTGTGGRFFRIADRSAVLRSGLGELRERSSATQAARSLRNRSLVSGIATSVAGRALAVVAPLIITPATFRYLGAERYGLWMAITSLTGMALFADLGLGNGLLTRLSALYATNDPRRAAREIASAYAMLTALAVVLITGLVVGGRVVSWAGLFNVHDPAIAVESMTIVPVCLAAFVGNIPLSLIQRIQYSQQQVGQSNLWQALGSIVSVVSVILAMNLGLGSASVIACAVLAVPFVNLVNSVLYFGFQNPALRPRLADVDIAAATDLLRLGLRFFLLSILTCAALNMDGLLSAHVLGLSAAANYALVARLFGALGLLVTLVCLPLWPANAEAMARGDLAWVRHNTRLMLVLSGCVVGVPGLFLVLVGNDILHAWVRSSELVAMPTSLLVSLLFWSALVAAAAPLFMVQNSIGLLGPQLLGWAAFLALSVVLKILLARSIGITGIPLAGCLSYAVAVVPAAVLGYRRSLETAEEKLLSTAGASCHV